jgi:hypothetical protein
MAVFKSFFNILLSDLHHEMLYLIFVRTNLSTKKKKILIINKQINQYDRNIVTNALHIIVENTRWSNQIKIKSFISVNKTGLNPYQCMA